VVRFCRINHLSLHVDFLIYFHMIFEFHDLVYPLYKSLAFQLDSYDISMHLKLGQNDMLFTCIVMIRLYVNLRKFCYSLMKMHFCIVFSMYQIILQPPTLNFQRSRLFFNYIVFMKWHSHCSLDTQMHTNIQPSSLLMECHPFVLSISVWMNGE